MGPSFNIVVVFVVVFFAQMFDLSQLLVRFYNRETLLRLMEHEQYFAFLVLSVPFLGNGKGAEVFIRGERAHRRSAFVKKGGNLISVFFLCVTHIFFLSSGTIGQVTVKVEVQQNDATAGSDFIANQPIFTFADKDNTSQNYLLTIKDDDIPETDEEFVIKLVNPTGGARVAPGLGNNVTIIIQANDGVAGQVGFDEQSRSVVAMEGRRVSLLVNRTRPNGRVSVDWLITGANASSDFTDVSGTVVFSEVWAFNIFFYVFPIWSRFLDIVGKWSFYIV